MVKTAEDVVPAYLRIRERVTRQIAQSETEGEKLPTVEEFCDLFKVSRPTVIRALKQLRDEGEIVSRRGMGMFINPNRQSKRYGRDVGKPEGVIGLIGARRFATYHLNILRGAVGVIADNGYHLQIVNPVARGEDILDELRPLKLDGLLWMWTDENVRTALAALDAAGVPLVSISPHEKYRSKNFVGVSFYRCGYKETSYLLDKGHRDIVYLCLPLYDCGGLEVDGMRQAYAERGITPERLRVVLCPAEDPTEQLDALFDRSGSFSAIIAPTEYYQYVMDALARRGRAVPDDCSVLTSDELSTQNLKAPSPTRLAYPLADMGSAAAAGLIEIVNGRRTAPLNVVQDWILIEGDTTRECPAVKR